MAVGDSRPAAFAARRSAVEPRHLRCCPGLVDEDELCRIEVELPLKPGFASAFYVFPALLGGVGNFF
jgi:hypothetical protein